MFESLTKKMAALAKRMRGETRITEQNSKEMLAEIRYALLEADVALPVVKHFISKLKEKALGQDVYDSLTPGQALIGIVNQELVELLKAEENTPSFLQITKNDPHITLLTGLQGVGKTTTCGKLAHWISKKRKGKVLLVSCDTQRPAAVAQLKTLANSINTDFFMIEKSIEKDPLEIGKQALHFAKANLYDYMIIDTAGRLSINQEMMTQLKLLSTSIKPSETLFVLDSMQGQTAVEVAKEFHSSIPITGIILTKTDGDSRGGSLISVKTITQCPIRFIGNSEKIDGLEEFDATRFADRILGMGDILGLVEKAQENLELEESEKIISKIKSGKKFDLEDYRKQLTQMNKIGGLSSMLNYLPASLKEKARGVSTGNIDIKAKKQSAIISSMTKYEKRHPEIIKSQRKKRIATGSGNSVQEVNQLLSQFSQMRAMFKTINDSSLNQKTFQNLSNIKSITKLQRKKINKNKVKKRKKRK